MGLKNIKSQYNNGVMKQNFNIILVLLLAIMSDCFAQQDPQYTQYMYNTQIVNPAYAGNQGILSLGALYRTQWVGLEGAPRTGTFTINSPVGSRKNMGLGLTVVHDEEGPVVNSNVTADYAYAIKIANGAKLNFGLKAGLDILNVDFSKLNVFDTSELGDQNTVGNKISPQVGAGVYYNTEKFYAGISVPNFFSSSHLDSDESNNYSAVTDRLHYFFISGYVFDVNANLKFKPATLVKVVSGAPLQWDLSANFLYKEKVTFGASYRWSSAVSGLLGFQISNNIFMGVAYDYQTTALENFSSGSYEVMLRFNIFNNPESIIHPRFF